MELNEEDIVWARAAIDKTGLFAGCSGDERAALYEGLEKQSFRPDATILFQGEISSRLCLVHTGAVAIVVRKGKEKLKVAELGAGSYFGEISLLTPRAATATVKAVGETEIVFLPGEVVQALVKQNPALADTLNKQIEERLNAQKNAASDEH